MQKKSIYYLCVVYRLCEFYLTKTYHSMMNFTFLNVRVYTLYIVFFTTLLSLNVFAKGTPQISLDSTINSLAYLPDYLSGSNNGCSSENRIQFSIDNFSTERMYFGFNWKSYTSVSGTATIGSDTEVAGTKMMYCRILNSSGTVEKTLWQRNTSRTSCYIDTYAKGSAVSNIGSVTTGYTPITFTPTATDDYNVFLNTPDAVCICHFDACKPTFISPALLGCRLYTINYNFCSFLNKFQQYF